MPSKALTIAATGDEQALQDMAKGGKHKVLIPGGKISDDGHPWTCRQETAARNEGRVCSGLDVNDVAILDNVADAKVISQTAQQLQALGTERIF